MDRAHTPRTRPVPLLALPLRCLARGRALSMELPLAQLPLLAAALALVAVGVLALTTFNPRITRTRRTP